MRAIDSDRAVLDILVQPRRNAKAAKRFLKKLINQFGTPRFIVTNQLRSYTKPIKALAGCTLGSSTCWYFDFNLYVSVNNL
ncbi:MAG: DDE-type integrase/transposase/recombinase [Pseudomonadota bacterium]